MQNNTTKKKKEMSWVFLMLFSLTSYVTLGNPYNLFGVLSPNL